MTSTQNPYSAPPENTLVELVRLRRQNTALQARLAEAAAAEAYNTRRSRLLSFVTHDLKSPLSALHTTCGFLLDSADDPAEIRDLAHLMQAEIDRMTRLVHDFLDRSALDTNALRLDSRPLDLAALARRIADDLSLSARLKHQTLDLHAPPTPLPLVMGDDVRLGQVLANLVDNAIKYSPAGGRVLMDLGHSAAGVWCAVQDSGPGLAQSDLERLFRPYERLSARPLSGESSHGLGLALAHELTTLHGGTLIATSPSGGGARFTVTLPSPTAPLSTPSSIGAGR